ncbi:MAG: ABC transporter permease [Terriglobales bacterium]
MKAILKMTWMHVKLSYRIKIAFFFTFIFPMAFFFLYCGIFAKSDPNGVAILMSPLISLSIISSSLFGLSVQLVVMRERDMLRRYHLAPITAMQMVTSRLLGNYLLFIPVVALQFLLAVWLYHMPLHGSLFGLWLVFTLGYLALGGIGLVVAGVVNTMQEAQVVNQILFFALLFLSGSAVPLFALPKVIQHIALFLPPTLMILASEGMLVSGQSLGQHYPELLGLGLTLVASLGLAVGLFRWEKEEKATTRGRWQATLAMLPLLIVGLWLNHSPRFIAVNQNALEGPRHPIAPSEQTVPNSTSAHPLPSR